MLDGKACIKLFLHQWAMLKPFRAVTSWLKGWKVRIWIEIEFRIEIQIEIEIDECRNTSHTTCNQKSWCNCEKHTCKMPSQIWIQKMHYQPHCQESDGVLLFQYVQSPADGSRMTLAFWTACGTLHSSTPLPSPLPVHWAHLHKSELSWRCFCVKAHFRSNLDEHLQDSKIRIVQLSDVKFWGEKLERKKHSLMITMQFGRHVSHNCCMHSIFLHEHIMFEITRPLSASENLSVLAPENLSVKAWADVLPVAFVSPMVQSKMIVQEKGNDKPRSVSTW